MNRIVKSNFNVTFSLFGKNILKTFTSSIKPKKDYYAILGISKNSTLDEIKKAYRTLAKTYHPDVSSSNKTSDPKALEKFREVAEAYAVLSNLTIKSNYDQNYESKPESVFNASKMKSMDESKRERDSSGNFKADDYEKGSYADFRIEKLKQWRKDFNFDNLGNFKGGVPRKYKGIIRGKSHRSPLSPYDGYLHNETHADSPGITGVQSFDAVQHKAFQNIKREENLRFKPYFNIQEVEMDSQYEQTSSNRLSMVIPLSLALIYLLYFGVERYSSAKEFKNIESKVANLLSHEYQMIGPVIIEAEKFKFNKKYLTRGEYHAWLDNDFRTFKQ